MDKSLDPLKILDINTKVIAGKYVLKGQPYEKWDQLNEPRDKLLNEHKEITKVYGNVRIDSQNKPRYHGQFDPDNKAPSVDVKQIENQMINKIATDSNESSDLEESEHEHPDGGSGSSIKKERAEPAPEYSERFPIVAQSTAQPPRIGEFIFKHSDFWAEIRNTTEKTVSSRTILFMAKYRDLVERARQTNSESNSEISLVEATKITKNEPIQTSEQVLDELGLSDAKEDETKLNASPHIDLEGDQQDQNEEEPDQVLTAHDYLNKLKDGKVQFQSEAARKLLQRISKPVLALDTQGFNSFLGYAPDLRSLRRSELVKLLSESVLFCDNDIVIINKPYGLISQGKARDEENSRSFNLPDLLPDLSEQLMKKGYFKNGDPNLCVCHRLDKNATGVLVLAASKTVAGQVQELFAERKVHKEYLTITRGIPDPQDATIDIPIEEGSINGKERMVLRPTLREELRRIAAPSKMAKRAVTTYKTLDAKGSAALLQIVTQTGVKHQIRVHLGFGLRCPILGDHKYSHLQSLSPQKLPPDMLMSLNVRPSKVRNIPLHLHSQVIFLPGMGRNKATVIARAPIPEFFSKTMKMLKLFK